MVVPPAKMLVGQRQSHLPSASGQRASSSCDLVRPADLHPATPTKENHCLYNSSDRSSHNFKYLVRMFAECYEKKVNKLQINYLRKYDIIIGTLKYISDCVFSQDEPNRCPIKINAL